MLRLLEPMAILTDSLKTALEESSSSQDALVSATILTRVRGHLIGELRPFPGWSTRAFDPTIPNPWDEEMAKYHAKQAMEYRNAA